jgi:hypothetical protein
MFMSPGRTTALSKRKIAPLDASIKSSSGTGGRVDRAGRVAAPHPSRTFACDRAEQCADAYSGKPTSRNRAESQSIKALWPNLENQSIKGSTRKFGSSISARLAADLASSLRPAALSAAA